MMPLSSLLGGAYFLSEIILGMVKRARSGSAALKDGNTTRVLWLIIMPCVFIAYQVECNVRRTGWAPLPWVSVLGAAVMIVALAIRWYSIIYLGRFFTVNVAIANDHQLIDGGPYRLVRHPSYTGALLAFIGLGICMQNWLSLLILTVGPTVAFLYRIRVEEAALAGAFGERYLEYMLRTQRLIPGVY
jgi:protein-S-isoprenylcysteine O-methyltransferase Ste14